MIRIIITLLFIIPMAAFGQGSIRRFSSIARMIQMNPQASAVSGKLTAEVAGYYDEGDWGGATRVVDWMASSALATNRGTVFASPFGGQWVFHDRGGPIVSLIHWGARGDGVTDDTAAVMDAARYVTPGKTLYAPAGYTFLLSNTIKLTNDNVTVDFNGSTNKFVYGSRLPAIQIGPTPIVMSGLSMSLDSTTNLVTGAPTNTFSAGDMVLLYNDSEDPPDYIPGQFAFVQEASGTTIRLDRFPHTTMTTTRAYRFALAPKAGSVRNVVVDLSECGNCIGISTYGSGHVVERSRVFGTGEYTDPNYIGIEARGQAITVRENKVDGIIDYHNNDDRSGYGIFLAGDSVTASANDIENCKHTLSTSERKARSHRLRMIDNVLRQRGDWEYLEGGSIFLGNLDVHANVDSIEIRGNTLESWGRYNFAIRNGNFEIVNNRSLIHTQSGLPFAQQHLGFNEAFIKRAYVSGNQFDTPDSTLVTYFGNRLSGYTGTHSNMTWIGNTFENGIFSLQDYTGSDFNPMVDISLIGNRFHRSTGTPVLFSGPVSNVVMSGNIVRYGVGNGVTIAVPGDDSSNPPRQIYITGNSFQKESGTGYDVRVISGPTNIVLLGQNKFSSSPTLGIADYVPVGLYGTGDKFPRVAGNSSGKILFGSGSSEPLFGLRRLYGGAIELDGIYVSKSTSPSDNAFVTYMNAFSNRFNFIIRSDGLQAYNYWVWDTNTTSTPMTNTTIVLGPRRTEDFSNGVFRLTGAFGITERPEPVTPQGDTASIWLDSDTLKSIKVKWPDGTSSSIWHAGSDGSGSGLDADLLDGQHGSYYLDRAYHTGTQSYTTITGLGQLATVDDAPIDGLSYGRKNGAWSQVVDSTHTHTVSNITGLGPLATSDAPTNGLSYGRNNGAWSQVADAFHTHDASDTVTGEFDPGLLGTGTADTDTFLSGGGGGSQSWRQVLTNDVGGLSDWMATKSDTGHTHAASNIVSGTLAAERLGTGTATTNTFLQGNGSNPPFWGTIPSTPSPTNGIADAPADGVFYGRKNNSWTQPDVSDLSGISSWGMSWIDGTVVDEVDALTTLTLVGGSPSTIESPARYSVRVNSGGSPSIRHRLNLIASGGLSLSLSDDGVNDESDTTVSIQDGGITTNKVASAFHQWVYDKTLSLHGTVIDEPNITDTATVEVTAAGPNLAFTVPNDSITYSKLQNVSATNRVLGLGSTAPGNATELAIGDGLITSSTDLKLNIEAGSGIEFATNGSKKITITSKGYTPSNDAVANLLLVTTSETTDNNQDATWRDVTPTARTGMSTTIPANTLLSGSVMKVEIAGVMDAADANWAPQLRMILDGPTGSDYTVTFIMNEPGSTFPSETTTWKAEAFIVVASAGSPATVRQRSFSIWADGGMTGSGSLAGYGLMTSGQTSNSLDTTQDNTFKLEYRGMNSNMQSFSVTSVVIWML